MRGVGAFGYFDMDARRYTPFRPREVASFEVTPGGLAVWNRETHQIHRHPLEFAITKISRNGEPSLSLLND